MILGYTTYRPGGMMGTGEVGPMVHVRRGTADREAARRNEYRQGRRLGTWEVVAIVRQPGPRRLTVTGELTQHGREWINRVRGRSS